MIRLDGRTPLLCLVFLCGCTSGAVETGVTASGIYYEASGAGPVVVLAHGFSLDRRMWDAEETVLRDRFRVIRYDLRGHGLSEGWSEPVAATDDLLGVLEATGVTCATIIGLSAGAQVAIDFALAHPNRVAGLVLASPGLGGFQPVGSFEWMAPVLSSLQAGEFQDAMRAWTETPLMRIASNPVSDSVMRSIVMDNWEVWTYDPELQLVPERPAIGRLSDIEARTLVLIGGNDLIDTKLVGDTLTACLARGDRKIIPNSGHLLNLEEPTQFIEVILGFLSGDETSRTVPSSGC